MIKKVYHRLEMIGKPLTVHAEMIIDDEVWKRAKEKALNGTIHKWYLITPFNFDIFKPFFRLHMDKNEFSEKLKERYRWLKDHGQNLQLHVHLSKKMKNLTKEQQRLLISKSVAWLEEHIQIKVSEMVPGWWSYNEDTKEVLKGINLKLIKRYEYKDCHDYDWVK